MSRSVRRVLFRLILLVSPFLLLTLTAFSLLTGNQLDRHGRDAIDGAEQPFAAGSIRPTQEDLQRQLQQLKLVIIQLEDRLKRQQEVDGDMLIDNNSPCTSSYIQKQIEQSEKGKKWHNEYEMIPHAFFTLGSFYPTEPGLGRRVVERPIGSRRQDLQEAVSSALSVLNHPQPKRFTVQDFSEGLYRIDPIEGTQYELWFQQGNRSNNARTGLVKISLLRPHAPLSVVRVELHPPVKQTESILNIVVPLSGRLPAFQSFLNRFHHNVLSPSSRQQPPSRIHLTVVFFGDGHWDQIQRVMLNFEKKAHFSNFHLLNTNGTFSRARGLQIGVEHWESSRGEEDVLIFLCDVDVDFDDQFLERCRRNSHPNRQAYFPMVFSLYNPNVTRRSHPDHGLPILNKETGFWRDFGFGMVCTYRSDFLRLGGFHGGESAVWGGEDLYLYRKYIRSTLRIVRSPDPNLFHLWHPKKCPTSLGPVQQRACLQSRARNEASHDQLALLLFADEEKRHNLPQNKIE